MVTSNTKVVGVGPDLSFEQFEAILESAPAASKTPECYATILKYPVSVAFLLAIFLQESTFGTAGYATVNKSPGNTRSTQNMLGVVVDTVQGKYVRYGKWEYGWDDLAYRLVAPDYVYGRNGLVTIRQILERFAPTSDHNLTELYIANVVKWMNGWLKNMVNPPVISFKGSPNYWVGRDSQEIVAICDHIMQGTMESSLGWFNNPKSQVSSTFGVAKDGRIWQFVRESDTAWANGILQSPDPALDWVVGANPNARSISIEHEGHTGDAFTEAQYHATLALHRYLVSKYNIPIDRQHIIGHYQIMRFEKANCPGTGFPWARLMADLEKGTDTPVADSDVIVVKETGKTIGGGFRKFWEGLDKLGANFRLANLGFPTTNEFGMALDDKHRTVQLFQRGGLIFEPENSGVWNVHYMTVDQLLLARREAGF